MGENAVGTRQMGGKRSFGDRSNSYIAVTVSSVGGIHARRQSLISGNTCERSGFGSCSVGVWYDRLGTSEGSGKAKGLVVCERKFKPVSDVYDPLRSVVRSSDGVCSAVGRHDDVSMCFRLAASESVGKTRQMDSGCGSGNGNNSSDISATTRRVVGKRKTVTTSERV